MESEILKIISDESGTTQEKISMNSTLLGDLKLDGDDAWEVFEQCQQKFKLDLIDFNFNHYFRNEPCFKGIIYLYRRIKYQDEHLASGKAPITVGNLMTACNNGRWAG